MSEKTFRPWEIDQAWLFPPSVRDFVPEGHLGERSAEVSADSNYCSETNLAALIERGVRGYVATGRQMLCTAHSLLKLAAARA